MTFKLRTTRRFNAGYATVEQITSIQPTTGGPYKYYPVITLAIGDVKANDHINLTAAYCQVSSKMPYNLMVGSQVILTSKPITQMTQDKVAVWGSDYREVTESFGTNITNNVHHHPCQQAAHFRVPYDMLNAHLTLIVCSASTAYDGSSLLLVDQDYGRMEGFVERDATAEDLQALLDTAAPAPEPPPPAPAPEPAPPPAPPPPAIYPVTVEVSEVHADALRALVALLPQQG